MSEQHNDLHNTNDKPDVNYWRSFEELHQSDEFRSAAENEFPEGASDSFDPNTHLSPVSRRKFFALIGASAALAAAGCGDYRDKGKIVSYNQRPEGMIIGKPNFYASTCNDCAQQCGILIRTREGRPIKVDGSPDHPVSLGKTCARGQGSVLNLYDPARIKSPHSLRSGVSEPIDWNQADTEILKNLAAAGTKQIAVIGHSSFSPTQEKCFTDFAAAFPSARLYSYELFDDAARTASWSKLYGNTPLPVIDWDAAEVVLTFEADLFTIDGSRIEQVRALTTHRDLSKPDDFLRLYSVEGKLSLTGSRADYRFRVNPARQLDFALALINEIASVRNKSLITLPANISQLAASYSLQKFCEDNKIDFKQAGLLVTDLIEHSGKAILYAGKSMPAELHTAVFVLNEMLGNTKLYKTDSANVSLRPLSSKEDFKNLISEMNAGNISAVIHYDSNPAYHFPKDLGYEEAVKKVPLVVSLSELENETTAISNIVLPIHHAFESWGDIQTRSGLLSLRQPVIAPLYTTRQKEAVLLTLASKKPDAFTETLYHDYMKKRWLEEVYPAFTPAAAFEQFWLGALHDGVLVSKEKAAVTYTFSPEGLADFTAPKPTQGIALLLTESYALGDGRFANNGWLQELPHPITKVTWDNYASVSYATAKALNLNNEVMAAVTVDGRTLELPVLVQPGLADDLIVVELGYGRTQAPIVALGVGFNANVFMSSNAPSPYLYAGASISSTGVKYALASTQDHYAFDDPITKDQHIKRDIIQEGTLEEYKKNNNFLHEGEEHTEYQMYSKHEYPGNKWGMSIDLNKCIGCGDCVVACNSENNIPVVGKDQVIAGREMMWMRIDRYYSGTPEDPNVSVQPMICQHCDQAPCENVCPVVATTHSADGLNQMVYNRCVGTRYCSNNCPYKVRRFNFFDFRDHFRKGFQYEPSLELVHNPEVTVRSRGVMEKCTFCIQRIEDARIEARKENRVVTSADVSTACSHACPANAIVFGDMNEKESDIAKFRAFAAGYRVLDLMNVKPNVTYLAKLRNTHPEEA